jgi:hypothetical protein
MRSGILTVLAVFDAGAFISPMDPWTTMDRISVGKAAQL